MSSALASPAQARGTPPRLPDFLCIGAMRCGTTTLWEMLRRHPRVFMPERKEIHFFDNRDGQYDAGLGWYREQFRAAPDGAVRGEFSPAYIFVEEACERIRAALPDTRLVAILRDPVARAWSHYWFSVRQGHETLSFERALDGEADRLRTGTSMDVRMFSYVARGRYLQQLLRFERAFSREQICVVLFEDLMADPVPVLARVCAHIGVEASALPPEAGTASRNRAVYPRWARLHVAAKRARRWGSNRRSPLGWAVRALAGSCIRINDGLARPPRMRPETRQRLLDEFRDGNRALAAWLDRPLPWPDA